MRSARNNEAEEAGQDSFLDIVANIVGILILLVMVVGVRAARRPAEGADESQATTAATSETADAKEAIRQAARAAKDAQQLARRAAEARREVALQDHVRVELATFVAAAEDQIKQQRQQLEEGDRRDYDTRVELAAAQRRLDELTRQQAALLSVESEVETVESLPTPIAQTVRGDEVHLRLSGGRVTVIPIDALLEELKADARNNKWRLANRKVASATIGPIGGFRLRYTFRKSSFTSSQGSGVVYSLDRWVLLPYDDQLAEPVEQAIEEGSALRMALAAYAPSRTAVTVWTYPDSFNEFRTLKRTLYEMGYRTAGRPLPADAPIGGSPHGSRSAAQ